MKTMKQCVFEQALYYEDEYNRLRKQLGEESEAARIKEIQLNTIKSLIDQSDYTVEYYEFKKHIFYARQEFEKIERG